MNLEHSLSYEEKDELSVIKDNVYEAPAIESVLTPESLEREVHYAGFSAGSNAVVA